MQLHDASYSLDFNQILNLIVVIFLVSIICPIVMIWAVKIDDRKNA
jgi:hypothetical protein